MEQFLTNFFNDNSVCVGLCDLGRKIAKINYFTNADYQAVVNVQLNSVAEHCDVQPKKQSLAQYFLQQQQAYAQMHPEVEKQAVAQKKQEEAQKAYMAKVAYAQKQAEAKKQALEAKQAYAKKIALAQKQAELARQAYAKPTQPTFKAQVEQVANNQIAQAKTQYATKAISRENLESYIQKNPNQYVYASPETVTIINGSMKKIISSAVPAKH